MNKKFYFLLIAFTVLAITATYGQAVGDKCKSGNLYYKITKLSPAEVELAPQNDSYPYWNDADKPAGTVTVPEKINYNGTDYTVTKIGNNALLECGGVTAVNLPNTVTVIGFGAFTAIGITTLAIPASVTTIQTGALGKCQSLETMVIPETVTDIGGNIFEACSNLKSVTLPSTMTSIPYGLFMDCSSLKSITIPAAVTDIEAYVYSGCTALSEINCPIADPATITLGDKVFLNVPKGTDANACKLYVPTGSKATYEAVAQWKDFAPNIIEKSFTGVKNTLAEQGIQVRGGKGTIEISPLNLPQGDFAECIANIYNVSGSLVRTVALSGGQTFLSVKIPAGIYMVKIGNAAEKVIVQ